MYMHSRCQHTAASPPAATEKPGTLGARGSLVALAHMPSAPGNTTMTLFWLLLLTECPLFSEMLTPSLIWSCLTSLLSAAIPLFPYANGDHAEIMSEKARPSFICLCLLLVSAGCVTAYNCILVLSSATTTFRSGCLLNRDF